MKYVHDGRFYVIFSTLESYSHASIVSMLQPFKPKHAGFVSFDQHFQMEHAYTHGWSVSLNLKSVEFNYDEINYVGISNSNYIIISNSKEILEKLNCKDIEEAKWENSEGNDDYHSVVYPAHSLVKMSSFYLLYR